MTKRTRPDSEVITSPPKRSKARFHTTDLDVATSYQLTTKINTRDGKIVYTNWSIFRGLEYFDGLLESGLRETPVRTLIFDYLNDVETEIYLDILTIGCDISKLSQTICLNLYYQFDKHLIQDPLDSLKKQIVSHGYTLDLYNFYRIFKPFDIEVLAKMYIEKISDLNKIECPPLDDDIFGIKFLPFLVVLLISFGTLIRDLPASVLEKHLKKCNPYYNIKSLRECTDIFSDHPNFIPFVKVILGKWEVRDEYLY